MPTHDTPAQDAVSFTLKLLGHGEDSRFYNDLPEPVQDAVDKVAREVFDPEGGHALILGHQTSGKSFIIEQFAANVDKYLEMSGLDNFHVLEVTRADANHIEGISNGVLQYIDVVSEQLKTSPESLCLVTESPDFAAAVYAHSKQIKVILELNSNTFKTLETREQQGISKIWSSWGKVDANDVYLTREEMVASLHLVMSPKILKNYSIELEDGDIDHLLEHYLDVFPEAIFTIESEDQETQEEIEDLDWYNRFVVPPGYWALAIRKLASAYSYSSNKRLLNDEGEKDLCKHIDYIMEELSDEIVRILNTFGEEALGHHTHEMVLPFALPQGAQAMVFQMPHPMFTEDEEDADETPDTEPIAFSEIGTLAERLKTTIMGQDQAVDSLVDGMAVPAAGINDLTKPIRTFLFLGPTGVGKTELALSLAREVAAEPMNVIRLDMSEYSQSHEASKLLGAPSGYVGFEEGGVLTNAVLANPRSIILLDEVEKAHTKIWDSFLQIFDAGRMTDNKGRVVDFSRCIIIMTSNLGIQEAKTAASLGFSTKDTNDIKARAAINTQVEKFFRPEFINRIDEIVYFNQLSIEIAREIVRREITLVSDRMVPQGFKLSKYEDSVVDEIIGLSDFGKYGARDIQRAVIRNVSQPLAKRMLNKEKTRKSIRLTLNKNNKIQVY